MPSPRPFRATLSSIAAAAATLFVSAVLISPSAALAADEVSQQAARDYAIPAGPLASVLNRFAAESGVLLSADGALTQGKTSPGLNGRLAAAEALTQLLQGTGLQAVRSADGTYSLRPAPEDAMLLPAVKVEGASPTQETATGPAQGYVAKRSATATKTDVPLIETPQSVTVITRQQMEAQNTQTLEQVFAYSAGIASQQGGGGNGGTTGTAFSVRGFNVTGSAPLYLNGSKFPINSLSGPEEPFLYERIELLKGPASVLYGQATPGGIINLVSKRPTEVPMRDLELQIGSWDHRQINADVGGPIGTDGKLGYRLTGLLRESGSMIDYIPNDRGVLSGALSWELAEQTSLLLLASYMDNHTAYDYGKPYDGTILPNPNGRLSRNLFVGEPAFDRFTNHGYTLGYQLEHRFNDRWQLRQNVLKFDRWTESRYVTASNRTDAATQRIVSRVAVLREDDDYGVSVDTQLQGKIAHGLFQHTLLAGVDYGTRDFSRVQRVGTAAPLDVYDPVYGSATTLPDRGPLSASTSKQLGLYLQDHIKIDEHWVALLGLRWDDTKSESRSVPVQGAATGSAFDQDALTGRVALLYLFDNGFAPYVSWTESFQPQSGFDFAGNAFDPTTGEQYEAGFKFEPSGINASLTVAIYELTRQNVLTADPDNLGFSIQTGEVRSRGLEVEGRANLNSNLDLIAGYGYTDAEITRSNNGDQGRVPTSMPRHTASLWLDYHWRNGALNGLSASAGVRNVGRSLNPDNTVEVPDFTVYDAALRYLFGSWRFSLNVKNLFDKEYVGACTFSCFYGDERNISVTARYSW